MYKKTISQRENEEALLNPLRVNQLYSIELLVENITIEHGPFKNIGDLDIITESESSDDEEEVPPPLELVTAPQEEEIEIPRKSRQTTGIPEQTVSIQEDSKSRKSGVPQDGQNKDETESKKSKSIKGRSKSLDEGKKTPKDKSRSTTPKIKQTCFEINIDSWPPGLINSKAYMPKQSQSDMRICRPDKCVLCQDLEPPPKKPPPKPRCTCPPQKEYCFTFPIDSLGPKISSKSGVVKVKCKCNEKPKVAKKPRRPKTVSASSRDSSAKKKVKPKKPKSASEDGSKKKLGKKKKGGKSITISNRSIIEEVPKQMRKKIKPVCPKRKKVEGLLPPLRISVSIFHMKDVKVNQVDLEKLYPPEDKDPPQGEEEEFEVIQTDEPVGPVPSHKTSNLKRKSKKDAQSKSPKGKKSPSKKSVVEKDKTSASVSRASSKASKNVVQTTKPSSPSAQGVDGQQLREALLNLKATQMLSEQGEHDPSSASKYKELAGLEGERCSGDSALKDYTNRRNQYFERKKRKEVIESLRPITDFKRGISTVFATTALDLINRLSLEKIEIVVERYDGFRPPMFVGKVKVKLPIIYRDRIQAGARPGTKKPLWTCMQETYPILDCKKRPIGTVDVYFCLTSLGRGMVSTALISDRNLYEYTDAARLLPQSDALPLDQRATAFRSCYGNLQRLTHKDYDANYEFLSLNTKTDEGINAN